MADVPPPSEPGEWTEERVRDAQQAVNAPPMYVLLLATTALAVVGAVCVAGLVWEFLAKAL